jgi:hypothetical protein
VHYQVTDLLDYYSSFKRRIDLDAEWRNDISKLEKLESSLKKWVPNLGLPREQRAPFLQVCAINGAAATCTSIAATAQLAFYFAASQLLVTCCSVLCIAAQCRHSLFSSLLYILRTC